MDHDANSPSEKLAQALIFHPDKKVKPSKSTFDMLEIASTISNWRRQDTQSERGEQGMDEYYGRYIVERLTGKESVDTIKSLCYKGLEALMTKTDQNRWLAEREDRAPNPIANIIAKRLSQSHISGTKIPLTT